jgi:hypothetical protein
MSIEEFIESSNQAQSVDELFELYKTAMAKRGFDRLIFSLMTDHAHIKMKAGHGIMLNYPEDWMQHYTKNSYDVFDPVRCSMYSKDSVFIWEDLLDSPALTKNQVSCLKQGEDAGLRNGIGIPLRGPHGAIAGIGAASSSGGVEFVKLHQFGRLPVLYGLLGPGKKIRGRSHYFVGPGTRGFAVVREGKIPMGNIRNYQHLREYCIFSFAKYFSKAQCQ